MKIYLLLLPVLLCSSRLRAQNILVMKLDTDNRMDTVVLDRQRKIIICALSTQQYRHTESQTIALLNPECTLYNNGSGFDFRNDHASGGVHSHFEYNAKKRLVELTGISRYDGGDPSGNGSGKSAINLLTHSYTGSWNYYDDKKDKLVALPDIAVKLEDLQTVPLDQFSNKTYEAFAARCEALYRKEVRKIKTGQ